MPIASAATAAMSALERLKRPGRSSRRAAAGPSAVGRRRRTRRRAPVAGHHPSPPAVDSVTSSGEAHSPSRRPTSRRRRRRCGLRTRGSPPHRAASAGRPRPNGPGRPHPQPRPRTGRRRWPPPWRGARRPARRAIARHHPDLVGAVELVAGEIEQHHHRGLGGGQHPGQVDLVDLEHRQGGAAIAGQRGHVSGRHVRTGLVAHHLRPAGPQRHGEQPGRRRLAVGAAHQRHRRDAVRCSRSCGSTSPARPPATVPCPRPRRRDAALTARCGGAPANTKLTRGLGARQLLGRGLVARPDSRRGAASEIAAMIAAVSATASVAEQRQRAADPDGDRGRVADEGEVGHAGDERGHTFSVPHRSRWARPRLRSPRPGGPRPVLPCSIGVEEGLAPRDGALREHDHHLAGPQRRLGRAQRPVRPLPRSTGMPPMARAMAPTTGASKISFLPKNRTGRPSRAATRASAATSK